MPVIVEGSLIAKGRRFAIVASRFNDAVTSRLIGGAVDAFLRHGVADKDIRIVRVPGSFEIPVAARKLAATGRYGAVVCLGALVRGETPHFDHLASEAARGVGQAALETGVPVIFGVLTTDSLEQAIDRAGGKAGNKGWDSALAAIEMANLFASMGSGRG
jgi:6,7-dimethyl-8-ribityllumazine synthase